jgi:putative selenate reductase
MAVGGLQHHQSQTKTLVIGAGPAGIAAATYLRRAGIDVTVREKLSRPMGIVSHVIPEFRISSQELELDIQMAQAQGVRFEFNTPVTLDLPALRREFDHVIIATGAWESGAGDLEVDGVHVLDALDFLRRSKDSDLALDLGKQVAVIGGGDVAMDCARAAARNRGVEQATIVYRRTRAQMPAQREELELAVADGVRFVELHAPSGYGDGRLRCDIMQLGAPDAKGRASVSKTDKNVLMPFDTVICAVGARVDTAAFAAAGLEQDARGFALLDGDCQASLPGVYVIGDCKAGPATVVRAMADAKRAATAIITGEGLPLPFETFELEACREELLAKKGILEAATTPPADAARCLGCNTVCEICVDVCPNRANVSIDMGPAGTQVIHLDGSCNECGHCGVFCPTAGDPYKDKFTLYATREDFDASHNPGVLPLAGGSRLYRDKNGETGNTMPQEYAAILATIEEKYGYLQ